MAGSAALTAITVCRDPGSTRVHVWHHCTAVDTCVLGADHVDTVNEGIHTEGAEVDIWGRVGGGYCCRLVTSVVGKSQMVITDFSETLVPVYQCTRRHISEGYTLIDQLNHGFSELLVTAV